MTTDVRLDIAYAPSEDIVAREIEGELIIVPLAAGIGGEDDELFSLNDTGRAIWKRLDGRTTLREVARALAEGYNTPEAEIAQDVRGLVQELVNRRMVVEVPS